MMKRRWSNNGGFAFRMHEDSSTEVTSSSNGLVLSTALSPSPLDSPVYGEPDLWYDAAFNGHGGGHSVITAAHGCAALLPPQTTIIPLPPLGGGNGINNNMNGNAAGHIANGGNFNNGNGGGNGGGGGALGHGHQLGNGHLVNQQQNAQNNNNNNNNNMHLNNNMLHTTLNQGLMNGLMSSVLGGNMGMQHNGLNMQQHTPRSDSANSISS
ncbi:PREDICTED: ecdysone receptor-like, partial [Rhagoletis zephyria]|uniref:ecdysone receptor-like n=1 Tax=Rhagoletis zephyria TaxID=28612 RepID=UPI0008116AAB